MAKSHGDAERERHEKQEELREKLQDAEDEKAERDERVKDRLETLKINHEASKRLTSEITRQREFALPPFGWNAEDFLAESDEPIPYVVKGLHYDGFNSLLVAEHKTGKTTLEVNLAAALVDNKDFLGKFATVELVGNVGFFNYEMDERQFRGWLNESDIENIDRIFPLNLRGWTLPFWDEETLLRLAEWINKNEISFIILDPASKAWRGLVDNESDNVQLAEFFGAIDTLKAESGCANLLLSVHTPRDSDRARGGGEIEAWPDSLWYLSKVKGTAMRSLKAVGRDVELSDLLLEFDPTAKALTAGGSARDHVAQLGTAAVVEACREAGGYENYSEFQTALKGKPGDSRGMIKLAIREGLIEERQNGEKPKFVVPD